MAFKEPTFQDRAAAAAKAKEAALQKLKAKPALDPAVVAERAARREAKEIAEREKAIAKRAAQEAEKEAKIAAAEAKLRAEQEAAQAKVMTEAEKKAARDARYAARKARK